MLIIEKVLLLKNSEIFHNCREADLMEIATICHEIYLDKNNLIFRKGEKGNCMYFIHSGKVSIHDGEHQLAVLTENEIFGELSLLDAEARSASATTMTECTLLKIEQEAFYDLVATNTDVLKGIMRTLCRRLREQDRITVEMIKTRDKKTIPET
ncbi:MAG: cyclic nucleotide-binding domain-containing protein [Bacteroidales bacterium]|jgi:CRP-like cAMP-binding protein|nr:cyclic nucleotide-binding domain-containing protein [Bacteroidales bacterium]